MLFPYGSLPSGPHLETKKAILLLDLQNDFIHQDGKLSAASTVTFISKLSDLVARFRETGEVVWTNTEYQNPSATISVETGAYSILLKQFVRQQQDFGENASGYETPQTDYDGSQALSEPILEPDVEAFLAAELPVGSQRCCLPGSWGAEFPPEVESAIDHRKDLVIKKSRYSAFADMSLLMELRKRTVTDLYVCGSLSNISVYATVLDAVRHGFGVTLVEDCLGYRDESCHFEAVRQMADNMCAEGIDYQELMDDLAGILGDVIKEETYTTKYHVDISRPQPATQARTNDQHVNDWISIVESSTQRSNDTVEAKGIVSTTRPASSGSEGAGESSLSRTLRQRSSTLESSPPRKRSTNDLEELEEAPIAKLSNSTSLRRLSREPCQAKSESRSKKSKPRLRRPNKDRNEESHRRSSPDTMPAQSVNNSPNGPLSPAATDVPIGLPVSDGSGSPAMPKKASKKKPMVYLGPYDQIGDGTSKIIHDVIDDAFAEQAFEILKTNVIWQKMFHRSGEVPRLVAVQGDVVHSSVDNSTTFPIYRHPADESPELLKFDPTVEALRQACERHVGHTLNHVLIQHYRNSEDNISEHSDKSLDIVHGSSIVNLSLGAQRTMTLRSKKVELTMTSPTTTITTDQPLSPTSKSESIEVPREMQRVLLPHNSLFILSSSTNAKYLHSIRADKRPASEKTGEELAFDTERISLTFRHIGTYITTFPDGKQLIWGQGARGKTRQTAGLILSGDNDAKMQGEAMIIGFGKENHEGASFDWEGVYGSGFDVLNFEVKSTAE